MVDKECVVQEILKHKIIAIVRGIYGEKCVKLAQALHEGGVNLLEVTFDQSNPQSPQETADTLQQLGRVLGGKMLFGTGTVLSAQQVDISTNAGAQFIISPNTDESVIAQTLKHGLVSIPRRHDPLRDREGPQPGSGFRKALPGGSAGL